MDQSFDSSASSEYRPNADALQLQGQTTLSQPRRSTRSPLKSPSLHQFQDWDSSSKSRPTTNRSGGKRNQKNGTKRAMEKEDGEEEEPGTVDQIDEVIDAVYRRTMRHAERRVEAQKARKVAEQVRQVEAEEITGGARNNNLLSNDLVVNKWDTRDTEDEEELKEIIFRTWSATDMRKLLEVIQIHGSLHMGYARQALPRKTEAEIKQYFDYLSTDSTSSLAINSTVRGLVYTPSFGLSSAKSSPTNRKKRRSEASQQDFSGYMESRATTESFRPATERINMKEAVRRSLEDPEEIDVVNTSAAEEPVKSKKNHAGDWLQIIDRLHEQRGAPCNFSENLIVALKQLATLIRQYDNKQDHQINKNLFTFMYDNLYKYVFCLLKGVEPIELSPIESGIMLEVTERLQSRVRSTDISKIKEYLNTIKEYASSGSLRFDTAADDNLNANYESNDTTKPDMMSVNPLCISTDLLVPVYLDVKPFDKTSQGSNA